MREKRVDPAHWVSLKPFGIGEGRPNNYLELWNAFRENRGRRRYAWQILKHGTCDGCALGTVGMRDWTTDEVHLCNVRLRLLRLNTMPAMAPGVLSDVRDLRGLRGAELRDLGRLPRPMIRERGDAGFRTISWDAALTLAAGRLAAAAPDRFGVYLTSRGTPNETYYAAQKAVRALGSNSIDNAARVCHAPSTVALKQAIGVAATTCSYTDWIGSDLIVFIGSNVANNQPVAMKYLYHARKAGTRVAVVNPYREPGMDRYWVPSNLESALFGTRMTDRFFTVSVGGDVGFLNGVLKHLVEQGWVDDAFVDAHTTGFAETAAALAGQPWEALEADSGTTRDEMAGLAHMLHEARTGVLVWSMGVTQHVSGEDNVRAIVNLGLAKGFVGRKHCGLMPIRGHSGVQGGAEMGAYATALPGGVPVMPEAAATLGAVWGFPVLTTPGLTAPEMLDAAHDGVLDVLVSSGGNFLDVLPDPEFTASALGRVPLRVHIDICLSSQMLVDPADTVLVLPAQTRYEMEGGNTETSTERRVIFNPEVAGPRVAEAWPEWRIFTELAARARPELADRLRYSGTAAIRDDIARTVPGYEQIRELSGEGDQFQWGGEHLCEGGRFPTPNGRAHFHAVTLSTRPPRPEGSFVVATRRGKQFNSMVHERRDPLNGAERDAVLISPSDAAGLGLSDGDAVLLRSDHGMLRARVQTAPVAAGSLQVHWPEAQALLARAARSPESGVPDYNAVVTVEPERQTPGGVAP